MSRHTLSDGITIDERITPDLFDLHIKELAPAPSLVGKYYRKELDFDEYRKNYLRYLQEDIRDKVVDLIIFSTKIDVTLLCIEESSEFCHRKILLEYASKLASELEVDLKIHVE